MSCSPPLLPLPLANTEFLRPLTGAHFVPLSRQENLLVKMRALLMVQMMWTGNSHRVAQELPGLLAALLPETGRFVESHDWSLESTEPAVPGPIDLPGDLRLPPFKEPPTLSKVGWPTVQLLFRPTGRWEDMQA
ncbi:unnamed protein product [Protopolystoma xenopodis]|uniref:Uncharacterized protein n=1 Tax=Protopolystoma xenopodis TaxID=117903 RepID=A0A448XG18_9PLAT|nr:unnamed protein product [Protopolystoma xenopodis]